jgi:hypothetical protein
MTLAVRLHLALVLSFALFAIGGAKAGDHLLPERSVFGYWNYPSEKRMPWSLTVAESHWLRAFAPMFNNDFIVRMIMVRPFVPPEAVGLEVSGNRVSVVAIQGLGRLESWHGRVRRCNAPLPLPLARKVVLVWKAVLLETRYDPDVTTRMPNGQIALQITVATDTPTTHFAENDGAQQMSGVDKYIDAGTPPAQLEGVALGLRNYCFAPSAVLLQSTEKATDALLTVLPRPLPEAVRIPDDDGLAAGP